MEMGGRFHFFCLSCAMGSRSTSADRWHSFIPDMRLILRASAHREEIDVYEYTGVDVHVDVDTTYRPAIINPASV